jgi:hypothetical protein
MNKKDVIKLLVTGDAVELPAGMKVYHNQGEEVLLLQNPAVVVVEATRVVLPFQQTGVEAHFEETGMIKARALQPNGEYFPEGALLTFAQYGDFRAEFILPDKPNIVLRKMVRKFVKPNEA